MIHHVKMTNMAISCMDRGNCDSKVFDSFLHHKWNLSEGSKVYFVLGAESEKVLGIL